MAVESFKKEAGGETRAYRDLLAVFTAFQRLQSRYEEVQPQKWLLPDGPERAAAVAEMKSCRRGQAALFAGVDVDALLAEAETKTEALDEWERGNLRLFRRQYTHFSGFMDTAAMEHYEDVIAAAETAWLATLAIADRQEAFRRQIPILESAFAARRRVMAEPARRMGVPVSQACLDIYNPGMTNAAVDDTFDRLAAGWPRLMERLREKEKTLPAPLPITQEIPADAQLRLFAKIEEAMLEAAGWDKAALARAGIKIELTTAQTGFSWGSGKNIKLAIETDPHDLLKGLANAMHECGHMLYMLEMNRLPASVRGTPAAQPNGTAKNESAALYFERVGLQKEFFALAAPLIRRELGVDGPEWQAGNLYRLATRHDLTDTNWGISEAMLAPNMAWRALADRRILDGEMTVSELPEFRARTMEEFTGIPHDPKQFIVGEDHWPAGLMGYFHAYQAGAMDAAALHDEIAPDSDAGSLREYLRPYYKHIRDRIFSHGSRESPESMLDADAYLEKLVGDAGPGSPAPPPFRPCPD